MKVGAADRRGLEGSALIGLATRRFLRLGSELSRTDFVPRDSLFLCFFPELDGRPRFCPTLAVDDTELDLLTVEEESGDFGLFLDPRGLPRALMIG